MKYFEASLAARRNGVLLGVMSCKKDLTLALVKVSNYFNVKESDILSKSRKKEFVEPRHALFHILRTLGHKWVHIGHCFGYDHTTIMSGFDKVHDLQDICAKGFGTPDDKRTIEVIKEITREVWLENYESKAA